MKRVLRVMLLIITIMIVSGCSLFKKALTASEFKNKIKHKNFVIADVSSQFPSKNNITRAYVTTDPDFKYQIEYYEFKTEDSAKKMFNNNVIDIKSKINKNDTKKSKDYINEQNEYKIKSKGRYYVVIRRKNTMIYVDEDATYKKDIDKIIDFLKY